MNGGSSTPSYLNFDQLDNDVVVLSTGGKEIDLDPGEKMCPFQTVNWRHSGAGGIRQSADGRDAASTPLVPYTANTLVRAGDLTIDPHGAVTGTIPFDHVRPGRYSLAADRPRK